MSLTISHNMEDSDIYTYNERSERSLHDSQVDCRNAESQHSNDCIESSKTTIVGKHNSVASVSSSLMHQEVDTHTDDVYVDLVSSGDSRSTFSAEKSQHDFLGINLIEADNGSSFVRSELDISCSSIFRKIPRSVSLTISHNMEDSDIYTYNERSERSLHDSQVDCRNAESQHSNDCIESSKTTIVGKHNSVASVSSRLMHQEVNTHTDDDYVDLVSSEDSRSTFSAHESVCVWSNFEQRSNGYMYSLKDSNIIKRLIIEVPKDGFCLFASIIASMFAQHRKSFDFLCLKSELKKELEKNLDHYKLSIPNIESLADEYLNEGLYQNCFADLAPTLLASILRMKIVIFKENQEGRLVWTNVDLDSNFETKLYLHLREEHYSGLGIGLRSQDITI